MSTAAQRQHNPVLPLHLIQYYILPKLSIDLRTALRVAPGRVDMRPFEQAIGASFTSRYSEQYIVGQTQVIVPIHKFGAYAHGFPRSCYTIVYRYKCSIPPGRHPHSMEIVTYRMVEGIITKINRLVIAPQRDIP